MYDESRWRVALWLVGGVVGAIVFWLVQVLIEDSTIPEFMGQQIVSAGGYPQALTGPIGWGVHLGVSLSYALLFGLVVWLLRPVAVGIRLAIALVVAFALGWGTAVIAPPAISVTIGLLSGHGWPAELYPLNTELGVPFWNHGIFFLLNWTIQALGPHLGRLQ